MIKVDISNVWGEISLPDLLAIEKEVAAAHNTLAQGTGEGNDFLGWRNLPVAEPTEEMNRILDTLMEQLDQRQRQILRLRFGMEDGICHSLETISQIIGVSKERVRQIERQAIKRLNALGAEYGLEEFLG